MSAPSLDQLAKAVWVTWPSAAQDQTPAFILRRSSDDSRRARAASARRPAHNDEINAAATIMQGWQQPALFWVPDNQPEFDAQLAGLGYRAHDAAVYYAIPCARLAAAVPPPVTTFEIWEPLAIMADLWAQDGISPERQEVMARATCAKTAIFGRVDNKPAAAAYVGASEGLAMVHALTVTPVHRRKGLARHVMAQAAIWAARQGCDWLTLAVGEGNAPARALYASLGMAPVGRYHYRSPSPQKTSI